MDWIPQPKQKAALIRNEDEILYGGARGGGKTDAGIAWLLYNVSNAKFRALVIRRNADDLKDWVDRARDMYSKVGGVISGIPPEIKFPSGAIIRTGHLKDENAYTKYQGHEYQNILIEELTHIPREDDYEKLLGSCRSTVDGLKPQVFCTTNPDGPGYQWVKERFGIPPVPRDIVELKDPNGRSRVFIPARVEDNPVLMTKDPGYVRYLESIKDEELRKAWRNGDWSGVNVRGAYYINEITKAMNEGRITNVPWETLLPVTTWWDLGVGDATAIGFFQKIGKEWRIIDYYESDGVGLNEYVKVLREKPYIYERHYAPHDIEVRELTSGLSRKEIARNLGIDFEVVEKASFEEGVNALRARFNTLWIDKIRCAQLVNALSTYHKEYDEKRAVFKDKPVHDWSSHPCDMLRYWAMTPEPYKGEVRTKY